MGVASIVWVRLILTMVANSRAFLSSAARRCASAGLRCRSISVAAAMCMAVGIESFDDWLMFTWSFGWIGDFAPSAPPMLRLAALAMTSLTFILVCVPDPVCQTDN